MTSIEWLIEQLRQLAHNDKHHLGMGDIRITQGMLDDFYEQAKEMHKQEIMDFVYKAIRKILDEERTNPFNLEQYYQETFGSKGSDERIVDTNKTITEISDESWEGCDGCTEQDEIMYKNGYVKGYNAAIAELPKEISDEEIKEMANESKSIFKEDMYRTYFIMGAKWYREQLKQRQ